CASTNFCDNIVAIAYTSCVFVVVVTTLYHSSRLYAILFVFFALISRLNRSFIRLFCQNLMWEVLVNKTFVKMMDELGYDVELTYKKKAAD
ncbi:MAG: hypothetical protein IJF88_04590, partial [Oscillospiraceae bacterium]|nr:hypothetical protein [Oscillospiraceae bacterium]